MNFLKPKSKIFFHDAQRGFTLIELLLVMSIISLMASIVTTTTVQARRKATDARAMADFKEVNTALQLFYDTYGRMPKMYNYEGGFDPSGHGNKGACDAPVPGAWGADPALGYSPNLIPQAYEASMQELVDTGFLASVPHHPPGAPGYCYFDFSAKVGPGYGYIGTIMMTSLQEAPLSSQGVGNSCRPIEAGSIDWCTQDPSYIYCSCNSY